MCTVGERGGWVGWLDAAAAAEAALRVGLHWWLAYMAHELVTCAVAMAFLQACSRQKVHAAACDNACCQPRPPAHLLQQVVDAAMQQYQGGVQAAHVGLQGAGGAAGRGQLP